MNPQPPRIEFPCDYPIRIIGLDDDDYQQRVLEVVKQHAQVVSDVGVRSSRHARYLAVAVKIRATGESQLRALHDALLATGGVKLVL